ncbi:hypothetical protein BJX65DRAFT_108827 [Aspergillus insuetus]
MPAVMSRACPEERVNPPNCSVRAMSIAFQVSTPGLLGYTGRDFHEALSPRFLEVEARRTDDHIISARTNCSLRKCKCLRAPSLDRDGTSSHLRMFPRSVAGPSSCRSFVMQLFDSVLINCFMRAVLMLIYDTREAGLNPILRLCSESGLCILHSYSVLTPVWIA